MVRTVSGTLRHIGRLNFSNLAVIRRYGALTLLARSPISPGAGTQKTSAARVGDPL
jgi:hypothetical protein